ncbi:PREDICTED: uncharacterized protein LOC109347085 [Lupinus angustifolius]|uniref:uncharacterized protein LOC109347085 n=1 Tax=Lupinus angustifolius TaxID=3871 RepID=UPI00092EDDDF|nr:PREDICTED: uncharacterized protein LOC109347085 [Lupinus angustifolius]
MSNIAGIVIFSNDLCFSNVLYIPKSSFNLISVSQLTCALNCKLTFTNTKYVMHEESTLRMIGAAKTIKDLFIISSKDMNYHYNIRINNNITFDDNNSSAPTLPFDIKDHYLDHDFPIEHNNVQDTETYPLIEDKHRIKYPLSQVLSYERLSHKHKVFTLAITSDSEPETYEEVIKHQNWIDVIHTELEALNKNNTWILTNLPSDKKAIGCDDPNEIQTVKDLLDKRFSIKDLGSLKYFLGMEVARNKDGINLCQIKYALDLLQEDGLLAAKAKASPMDSNAKLHSKSGDLYSDITSYRRMIGKLVYLTHTRSDISYFVGHLSQFLATPTVEHFKFGLRVLRYIKAALGNDLFFPSKNIITLKGFSDSDWATCLDTRRSVTRFFLLWRFFDLMEE